MASAPKSDELFESIVANAFEFVSEAADVFERSPKLSAIHFFTAIELFLKARLVREHWTLIFLRVEDATAVRLAHGDFQSVGFKDSFKRITDVAGDTMPREAFDAFETLRQRRNKLVHLYSAGDLTDAKNPARLQIIQEQCRAWHYLYELLTRQWERHFSKHTAKIGEAARQMRRHDAFLDVRFDELKETIRIAVAKGATQHNCYVCRKSGLLLEAGTEAVRPAKCLVCETKTVTLTVTCECGAPITFFGEGDGTCEKCDKHYTPVELADLLHDDDYDARRGEESERATCAECDYSEGPSVVPFGGSYVCTNCLTVWSLDEVGRCEWCGERTTGDLSETFFSGCVSCDGRLGNISEDE